MLQLHYLLLQSSPETNSILSRFIVIIGFLIVVISFACLLFFIIARQKQNKLYIQTKAMEELEKQLLQSQVEVQEATLNAIGKELHDNVGQLLSSAKMLLAVAQRNQNISDGALKNADELLSKSIAAIRALSKMFDKDWIRQFSLLENLQAEVKRNNEHNDLKIHLSHPTTLPLNPDDQIILFRIIQEGIQNAVKHAKASNIYIEIKSLANTIVITVTDDGQGFNVDKTNLSGIGLNNIKVRAKSLGGNAVWHSLDNGTELVIQLNSFREKTAA